MRTLFTLILMAILLSGCPQVTQQPSGYTLGESIMVGLDERVTIPSANLELKLTDVQESRCPKGTNCMRAGEAKIKMNVQELDAVKEIQLEIKGMCYEEDGSCGNTAKAFGRTVELLYVYPYPSESNRGDRKYAAKVIVR